MILWPKIKLKKSCVRFIRQINCQLKGRKAKSSCAMAKATHDKPRERKIVGMILLINLHNDLWEIQKIWFETFSDYFRWRAEWHSWALILFQTSFMDLITNISTYSMLNWLCNDLTEMADQLKSKNLFFIIYSLLATLQKYLLFNIIFTVYCSRLYWSPGVGRRASIFISWNSNSSDWFYLYLTL